LKELIALFIVSLMLISSIPFVSGAVPSEPHEIAEFNMPTGPVTFYARWVQTPRITIANSFTVTRGPNHIGDPLTNIRPGDLITYVVLVRAHRNNAGTSYDTQVYMCFPDFLDIMQMLTPTGYTVENGRAIFNVGDLAPDEEVLVAFLALATGDAQQSDLIRYYSTNQTMGVSNAYTISHGPNHIGSPLTNIRPGDEIFYMFLVIAYEDVINAQVHMCFPDFLEITTMVMGDLYSVGDGVAIFCMGNLEEGKEVMVAFVATATDNATETVQSNLIRHFSYVHQ